jgi:hypothetical protein
MRVHRQAVRQPEHEGFPLIVDRQPPGHRHRRVSVAPETDWSRRRAGGFKIAVFRPAKARKGAKPALNSAKVPPTRGSGNREWRNVRLRRKWKR